MQRIMNRWMSLEFSKIQQGTRNNKDEGSPTTICRDRHYRSVLDWFWLQRSAVAKPGGYQRCLQSVFGGGCRGRPKFCWLRHGGFGIRRWGRCATGDRKPASGTNFKFEHLQWMRRRLQALMSTRTPKKTISPNTPFDSGGSDDAVIGKRLARWHVAM